LFAAKSNTLDNLKSGISKRISPMMIGASLGTVVKNENARGKALVL
jgi:hypothetical protein